MMEIFNVYIDRVGYRNKPIPSEIKRISINIINNRCNLSLLEISEKLGNGHTILASMMNGTRSKRHFVESKLLLLDFDNNDIENYISIEEILQDEFILNNCAFVYETFSSTEEKNKFRVVFALNESLTNNNDYLKAYKFLLEKYPMADSACKDSSRLFFGGKNSQIINLENRLDITDILSIPEIYEANLENTNLDTEEIIIPENYTPNNIVISLFINRDINSLNQHVYENNLGLNDTVNSVTEGIYYIYKLDMFSLLGLEYITPFNCVISEDNNPSSVIFKNSQGIYIYKRFSDKIEKQYVFNNLQIISKLSGLPINKTIKFMFSILNVDLKYPKEILIQEFQIEKFIMLLNNIDLKEKYPHTHKVLGRNLEIFKDLLYMFKDNKFEYLNDNNEVIIKFINSFGSKNIAKEVYDYVSEYRLDKMKKIISVLAYLEILTKLDDEDIPENILYDLLSYKKVNRNKRRKNLLELNVENLNLDKIEKKAKELTDMGFTYGGFKHDFLTFNSDIDTTNKVFNQDKDKKITEEIGRFFSEIVNYLDGYLLDSLYIFEKDLKEYLLESFSYSFIKENYNVCINSALFRVGCERVRANNKIKLDYNISGLNNKQIPTIIRKISV